ncbi:MAG TPA: ribosomal protein S18-alanine N-acetyltransferase [Bacillota bacterium]|nr:ribosomal protein S18-alanine N-acetyltransferase [Bacillota bacterium]
MVELIIRSMETNDLDPVMVVETATYSTPWTRDILYQEITHNPHAYYFVAEWKHKVIGYAGVWIVMDDAQITNIAIHPDYRGRKFGETLFRYVMQFAIQKRAKRLSLEVRKSNIAAQHLYRKFGLVPGGIRKNYYADQEDAIIMWVMFS